MRLDFRLKGYFSHQNLLTIRYGNGRTTTFLTKKLCTHFFCTNLEYVEIDTFCTGVGHFRRIFRVEGDNSQQPPLEWTD